MWFKPKGRQTPPTPVHGEYSQDGREISRRRFLAGTAVGVAGFVVSRFLPPLPGITQFLETQGKVSAAPSVCSSCGCPTFALSGCKSVATCIGPPPPNCTNGVRWMSYGIYYVDTHPLCVCNSHVCDIIVESYGCWSCC